MKREYNAILDDADSANRINFAPFQRDLHDQGHPVNLFLKIFILQENFCWLEDLEKYIYPWKESCGEIDNKGCLKGI